MRDTYREVLELRGKTEDEIKELVENKKTNIIHLLNFLEEISFTVDQKLLDISLVRNQFEGIVISVWQLLGPWVVKRRSDRGRPKIWKQVEDLYDTWK